MGNTPPGWLNLPAGCADEVTMRSKGWSQRISPFVLLLVLSASGCAVAEARVESPAASLGEAPAPDDGSVGTPDTDLGLPPVPDDSVATPDTELGRAPVPADGSVGTPNHADDGVVDLGAPPEPAFDPSKIDPADYPGQGVGDAPPDYFVYPDDD